MGTPKIQSANGALAAATTAQQALAAFDGVLDTDAKLIIQNTSSAILTFTQDGTTASATNGITVAANSTTTLEGLAVSGDAISVYGGTLGQTFFILRAGYETPAAPVAPELEPE